jgi:hypothetical protein
MRCTTIGLNKLHDVRDGFPATAAAAVSLGLQARSATSGNSYLPAALPLLRATAFTKTVPQIHSGHQHPAGVNVHSHPHVNDDGTINTPSAITITSANQAHVYATLELPRHRQPSAAACSQLGPVVTSNAMGRTCLLKSPGSIVHTPRKQQRHTTATS